MASARLICHASILSALILLTACKQDETPTASAESMPPAAHDPPSEQLDTETAIVETQIDGVPGGVYSEVETLEATVINIDREKRLVVLEDDAGHQRQVSVPPERVNFDQVQVGDRVKISAARETVISVEEPGTATDEQSGVAARAADGEKPGFLLAESTQVTATVESLDEAQRTATLKFSDGSSRVVKVRDDVAMSPDYVGKQVVITVNHAIAASVEKLEVEPAN